MLSFGTIETHEGGHKCRVRLEGAGLLTAPLPVMVPDGVGDLPRIGARVAILTDANREEGVVLGTIYERGAPVPVTDASEKIRDFSGGAQVKYTAAGNAVTVDATTVEITSGPVTVKTGGGKVEVSVGGDSLGAILSDILTALQAETHISAAPGSPTGPPVNIATYIAIGARVAAILD